MTRLLAYICFVLAVASDSVTELLGNMALVEKLEETMRREEVLSEKVAKLDEMQDLVLKWIERELNRPRSQQELEELMEAIEATGKKEEADAQVRRHLEYIKYRISQ